MTTSDKVLYRAFGFSFVVCLLALFVIWLMGAPGVWVCVLVVLGIYSSGFIGIGLPDR